MEVLIFANDFPVLKPVELRATRIYQWLGQETAMGNTSYIQTNFTVVKPEFDFIERATTGLNGDTRHFVKHVFSSSLSQRKRSSGFVPVPFYTIRSKLPQARWKATAHLLEVTGYSRSEHRSREFRPRDWLVDGFTDTTERLLDVEYASLSKLNLFSGSLIRKRPQSGLYDQSRHREPRIIQAAIRILEGNEVIFNRRAINTHLEKLRQAKEGAALTHGPDSREYQIAKGRYESDLFCYRAVLRLTNPENLTGEFGRFHPSYYAISSGRIQHKWGGFQTASAAMKAASYKDAGAINYDLKSSQVFLAAQCIEDAGFNAEPLFDYLEKDRAKLAAIIGIPEKSLKNIIISVTMGARVPKRFNNLDIRPNSIVRRLMLDFNDDQQRVRFAVEAFREVFGSLIDLLERWHDWLFDEWMPSNIETRGRKGPTVCNAVGKKLRVHDLPSGSHRYESKSRLAAHILQGREAQFIHTLTTLGEQYSFTPIANEHDGLITIGEIPKAAVEEAARLVDFRYAKLVEKQFVGAEDEVEL